MPRLFASWWTVLVAVVGGASACRPGASRCTAHGREVTIATSSSPTTLDWNRSHESSAPNYPVLHAMMRGLTTLNAQNLPIPGLASSWEVQTSVVPPLRETYTFHLRAGTVWSDGVTPLTATDFVQGWRRALLGADGSDFVDIVGAEEVLAAAARAGTPREVEAAVDEAMRAFAVTALDERTLRVILKAPRSYFLARVASAYPFFPAPSAALRGLAEEGRHRYFEEPRPGSPLVVGAFQVQTWDHLNRQLVLAANRFDAERPARGAVDQLVLSHQALATIRYEQCKVDFLFLDNPATLARAPSDTHRAELLSTYWLGMNTTRVPLALRRAISHGLDRGRLTQGLLPVARTASSYLPPGMPGALSPGAPLLGAFPHFDPALARREVAQAGDPGRELTLLVRGTSTFVPELGIADAIRQQLSEVGIRVRIVTTSNFANDIRSADHRAVRHDLFLQRTGADYAHPQTMFTPFQAQGNNYTDWERLEGGKTLADFQRVLDEGAATSDPGEMERIYGRAQQILLWDAAVMVPLYHPDRYYRLRPWIEGLSVDAFNFLTLGKMRLREGSP